VFKTLSTVQDLKFFDLTPNIYCYTNYIITYLYHIIIKVDRKDFTFLSVWAQKITNYSIVHVAFTCIDYTYSLYT